MLRDGRPELLLHPGLPKCGTSAIQRLLVVNDYAFCRANNLVPIGKDFKPFNGYPPVTEIMYECHAMLEHLDRRIYDSACRYILSSEALGGNAGRVVEKLIERFDIQVALYTCRFPIMIAWSQFCFSGWLRYTADELFDPNTAELSGSVSQLASRVSAIGRFGIAPSVCPVEPAGFESRFFRQLLRQPASSVDATIPAVRAVNSSIPMAAASCLAEAIREAGVALSGPMRSAVVRQAKTVFADVPGDLGLPAPAKEALARVTDDRVVEYEEFLVQFGCSKDIAEEAGAMAAERLRSLRELRPISKSALSKIRSRARKFVDKLSD